MGGMGAWTIGAHYPDRFAAVLAMSSRSDFYMWKEIAPESIAGFKRKLAEQEFGANLLCNYLHVPAFLIHGNADFGIPVEQSRTMYARLKERGMDAQYVELDGEGHFWFYRETEARPDLVEWLKTRKRVSAPRLITYRTYTLKYNRAYWAEILAIDDWGKAAEITCEISEDGAALDVKTENVQCLRLAPPKGLVKDAAALKVKWNGAEVAAQPDKEGRLTLGSLGAGAALLKTRELCGSVREGFAGPFLMVHGGEATESRALALKVATDWVVFAKGVPQVVPAEAVNEAAAKRYNLFLLGTPEENPITRRIMPRLPIQVRDGSIEVGGRKYDAKKYGLWMIYPNPEAPDRYVVINCGAHWGRGVPENHKYDMLPDFIVYADQKADDKTESDAHVCAGFFDQNWRLDERSTWYAEPPLPAGAGEGEKKPADRTTPPEGEHE